MYLMYYPILLLLLLYVVLPGALLWLLRRTVPLWFVYPAWAVVFSNLGLIFGGKLFCGSGLAVSGLMCFLLVVLFTARLPFIMRFLFTILMVAYAFGAGMMLGDATEFRISDFSDDFSGAVVGGVLAFALFFLIYLRGGLKLRR